MGINLIVGLCKQVYYEEGNERNYSYTRSNLFIKHKTAYPG